MRPFTTRDAHPAPGGHLAGEDALGQRRLDQPLHDLAHRARAEQRVESADVEQASTTSSPAT